MKVNLTRQELEHVLWIIKERLTESWDDIFTDAWGSTDLAAVISGSAEQQIQDEILEHTEDWLKNDYTTTTILEMLSEE